MSFIVLPGRHDGPGGYPQRRRHGSGARAGFLAASLLWGGGLLAWWWLS